MRNLPMECLRSFVTVTEVKGFTQAGQLLGRSQPAVSLQIKRLEELIGAQVFVRGSHRLELTQPGERMLDYARQILALNDEALAELALPVISGRVRFGIPSEYATILLPKVLGRFAHSYPAVTLEIHCDLSANLLAEEPNPYHLVLALSDSPERTDTSWIGADELVWVTSVRHDTHRQPTLPLIVAPTPCLYRARAIKVLKDVGRSWRISYTNTDISGIQTAIEEGLGVTVLAQKTVPDTLRILPFSRRFPRLGQVGVHLHHKDRREAETVSRLADYVRAIVGTTGAP
ncbi:MAG: LysR family transcriptional regulator [Xanthomonadales bacterium]